MSATPGVLRQLVDLPRQLGYSFRDLNQQLDRCTIETVTFPPSRVAPRCS
jgi:hypothetical protein